jgi:glycosyltransferase involved in cell wall biosynthesis
MTRVFHLAADLGPSAAAKQLSLIAPALPADRFAQAIGVLTPGGPFTGAMAVAGVELLRLPVRYVIDATRLAAVRRAVAAFRPDVVHAWGPFAARVAVVLRTPATVVSGCGSAGTGLTGWLTRKALRSARAVTAATPAEAVRIREAAGVAATVIPPAVLPPPPPPDPGAFRKEFGIPEHGRLLMSAGGFDAAAGLRTAVWAFDILKYADPAVYYVLFGDGPERGRVSRFSQAVGFDDDRVRFAGSKGYVAEVIGLSEVAWVTHLRGGVNIALEAMAAGVPVVAFHNRDLAGVIEDGVTGRLVPAGDRIRLAAATTDLLENPAERSRLGAAGRAAAEARFAPGPVVDRFAALYHDVTSATP